MRALRFVLAAAALSAVGCGASSDGNNQTAGNTPGGSGASSGSSGGGSSGGGSSGDPTGGGAGTTSPPSGSGGVGAAGGAAGAGGSSAGSGGSSVDPPGTVTITTDSFELQPGQEVHKCQNFDNPFGSNDTAIQRIVSDMSRGSHHLHLYNLTVGSSRSLEDCDFTDFHALVHAAGSPHAETLYPAGMARKIRGSSGLRIQLHYLNATREPMTVNASIKLTPVDAATVSNWVAQLYLNRTYLSIPPGPGRTLTTTCSIPAVYGPISLIGAGSHMHMRGVHFVATTSTGIPLIETDEWDEPPPVVYDPPIVMNPGDAVTWTCTYNNDTGQALTFGPSASLNEMCIYIASYYTSSSDATQLECQALSQNGGPAAPRTD